MVAFKASFKDRRDKPPVLKSLKNRLIQIDTYRGPSMSPFTDLLTLFSKSANIKDEC